MRCGAVRCVSKSLRTAFWTFQRQTERTPGLHRLATRSKCIATSSFLLLVVMPLLLLAMHLFLVAKVLQVELVLDIWSAGPHSEPLDLRIPKRKGPPGPTDAA